MRLFPVMGLLIASCASNVATATEKNKEFVVKGIYRYIDGDRIVWKCGRSRECLDIVIRDERLARSAAGLLNQSISLRVKRVPACGSESTQVACLRSRDGTALLIVEWL